MGKLYIVLCQSVFKRVVRSFEWRETTPISISALLLPYFWDFKVTPKILKLKWILWFNTVPGKTPQTTDSATNSWEIWCFCKRFPNFYIKWIQIYRETELQEGYLWISNTINAFQWQSCLNSKTLPKLIFLWFVM